MSNNGCEILDKSVQEWATTAVAVKVDRWRGGGGGRRTESYLNLIHSHTGWQMTTAAGVWTVWKSERGQRDCRVVS